MKKIFYIFIALLTSFIGIWHTFAQTTEVWDCENINAIERFIKDFQNKKVEDVQLTQIFPEEAMSVALKNLQASCDWKKIWSSSKYFIDHMLDIYLRRLDAVLGKDSMVYESIPVDTAWWERRSFIDNLANDSEWTTPIIINEMYSRNWKSTQDIPHRDETRKDNETIRQNSLKWFIKNYANWSLYDKYNLSCDLVQYFTKYLNDFLPNSAFTKNQYENCKILTKNRIADESKYVQIIMTQKSNQLLWDNMHSYLNTFFLWNKLKKLQNMFYDAQTIFTEINKNIKELTNKCS